MDIARVIALSWAREDARAQGHDLSSDAILDRASDYHLFLLSNEELEELEDTEDAAEAQADADALREAADEAQEEAEALYAAADELQEVADRHPGVKFTLTPAR